MRGIYWLKSVLKFLPFSQAISQLVSWLVSQFVNQFVCLYVCLLVSQLVCFLVSQLVADRPLERRSWNDWQFQWNGTGTERKFWSFWWNGTGTPFQRGLSFRSSFPYRSSSVPTPFQVHSSNKHIFLAPFHSKHPCSMQNRLTDKQTDQ